MIDNLITAENAAVRLGLSLKTVYWYVSRGDLVSVRFGRSLAFTSEALDAFQASKKNRGRPPIQAKNKRKTA